MLALRFWGDAITRGFGTPLRYIGGVSAVIGLILRAVRPYLPWQDDTVNVLLWAIPLAIFIATVVIGLMIGPYLLYREADDDRWTLREPKLRLYPEAGPFARERDPITGGGREVYRVRLETSGLTIDNLHVSVKTCDPSSGFILGAPLRMRGHADDDIFHRRIAVNPGAPEYPQLLEAGYDGNRLLGVYPSQAIGAPRMPVTPGVYAVIVEAAGRNTKPVTLPLRITVTSDPKNPVRIEPLD